MKKKMIIIIPIVIALLVYHEKENDHCIFKYKYIAAIFFMFNYTRNYNRR